VHRAHEIKDLRLQATEENLNSRSFGVSWFLGNPVFATFKSNQTKYYLFTQKHWRTAIAEAVFISAPQLLDNKRKKNYRYGIEGVVVDGLAISISTILNFQL